MSTALPLDLTGRSVDWTPRDRECWRAALHRAASEVDPSRSAPPHGDPALRLQLAELSERPVEQIVVTAGVRSAVLPLLAGCRGVLVERPTFADIPRLAGRAGMPVRTEPWPTPGHRWEHLGYARWVTAPCRNPDGRDPDPALLAAFDGWLAEGCLVVCNTAYQWYSPFPLRMLPSTAVLVATLHKVAGPGCHLGWIAAPRIGDDLLLRLGTIAPAGVWQRAWAHVLESGGLDRIRRRVVTQTELARAAFQRACPAYEGGGSGPNLLLRARSPGDGLLAQLSAVGICGSPGGAFHAAPASVRLCLTGVSTEDAARAGRKVQRVLAEIATTR